MSWCLHFRCIIISAGSYLTCLSLDIQAQPPYLFIPLCACKVCPSRDQRLGLHGHCAAWTRLAQLWARFLRLQMFVALFYSKCLLCDSWCLPAKACCNGGFSFFLMFLWLSLLHFLFVRLTCQLGFRFQSLSQSQKL